MKKLTLLPVILLFLGVMVSCNDDDPPFPPTNNNNNNGSNGNNSNNSGQNDNNSGNPAIIDSMYIAPNSGQNAGTDTLSFDPTKVKAVDLGLSVKWASLNIGATYTESMGTEFTWREVPNDQEDFKNQTEYQFYESMKIARKDDTAQAFWGGTWRMPTEGEFLELANNCKWTIVDNHPNLIKITGSNGNYIYFPAYNYWKDVLGGKYYGGTIYTSDVTVNNGLVEGYMEFYAMSYSYSVGKYQLGLPGWKTKFPVRPVMPK